MKAAGLNHHLSIR